MAGPTAGRHPEDRAARARARRLDVAGTQEAEARRTSTEADVVRPPRDAEPVFASEAKRAGLAYAGVMTVVVVAASLTVSSTRDDYLRMWVLAAAPFTTPALWLCWLAHQRAPAVHKPFWIRWLIALSIAYLAGATLIMGVTFGVPVLVGASTLLISLALPVWGWAALLMLRTKSGHRALSVDMIDAGIALVVLSAPGIYFFLDPLLSISEFWVAVPFAVFVAATPAGVYIALVNFARLPRGERETQGIALALTGCAAVNISLQVAQFVDGFTLPIPPLILLQAINMAMLLVLPLWASRTAPVGLGSLAPEAQVRRANPLPFIGAVVLPALGLYALTHQDEIPWGPGFVIAVLLVIALLNAVRYELMTRETRRLYAELRRVAEQRKILLTNMVRALEDDRHRMATELHEQAVESFATLGTLVQTAYVTLPPNTALAVKESIAHIQDDLSERVESLRRLMVAIQPPVLEEGGLATALRAYASELYGDRSGTLVAIEVDPEVILDWSTKTIVYRIAQEALDNASQHAMAPSVRVGVREEDGVVIVDIEDDGIGFDSDEATHHSGIASMQLFAGLGRGTIELASTPNRGTTVRARLGALPGDPFAPSRGEHLQLNATATAPAPRPALRVVDP